MTHRVRITRKVTMTAEVEVHNAASDDDAVDQAYAMDSEGKLEDKFFVVDGGDDAIVAYVVQG
jgi:hypothetical protein